MDGLSVPAIVSHAAVLRSADGGCRLGRAADLLLSFPSRMTRMPDIAYELAHRLNDLEHLTLYRELAVKVPQSDLRAALSAVEGTAWPSRIPSPALFLLVLGARIGHPL